VKLQTILSKSAVEAAPLLLGWVLVRQTPEGIIKLKIVETEAYHQNDPASHSFRGKTARTAPMFEAGGTIYVYFTYGMYYCLNLVVGAKGVGEAVLLRAAEPLGGIEIIQNNRVGITNIYNLASGPAKLTQALGITDTSLSGKLLNPAPFAGASVIRLPTTPALKRSGASKSIQYADIWLAPPERPVKANETVASPRIGIREAKQMPWRFYIKDNPFISKHPKKSS